MFTQDQHDAIAKVFRVNQPQPPANSEGPPTQHEIKRAAVADHHRDMAYELANMLDQDNSKFDWVRFIKAAAKR